MLESTTQKVVVAVAVGLAAGIGIGALYSSTKAAKDKKHLEDIISSLKGQLANGEQQRKAG